MIVVDLQPAQSTGSGNRGIGRYTRELVTGLTTRHPDLVDRFCLNPALPVDPRLLDIAPVDRIVSIDDLRSERIDLFHVTSPFELVTIDQLLPAVPPDRIVTTCFDLIPLRFPDHYLSPLARPHYFARLPILHNSDAIVTDSASAAQDCVDLLGIDPDVITVIGGGTNPEFVPPTTTLAERLTALADVIPAIREGYVFAPTGNDWRKNIDGAIAGYAGLPDQLQRRHQLVIGCKMTATERRRLQQTIDDAGAVGEILLTGFVTDADLIRLYQSAELVLFPSLYEGFGLPVLEARRCGARVVCSNVSSLPEVMPLTEATFNPTAVPEITAIVERALTDQRFRDRLDAAPDPGFTFELAADLLAEVYERALRPHRTARRSRQPRIAVVSPLPPADSAVAQDVIGLLGELADVAEVTAFGAQDTPPLHHSFPVEVLPLEHLPRLARGGAFDAVVYVMANDPLHRPLLPLIERVPGHVLFHDVGLDRCYRADEREEIARRWYGDDQRPHFAAPVANAAVGCLVTSVADADLLNADAGVDPVVIGAALSGPAAAGPPLARQSHGSRRDDRVPVEVVTVSDAYVPNHTERFVEAVETVIADHPDWRATVIGRGGAPFVSPNSAVCLDDTAGATGATDLDRLQRADLLVQLDEHTGGGASAVVAAALGLGVATVVTDTAPYAELPDDAVVKVPLGISAGQLARLIEELATDTDRRARLAEAAIELARSRSSREQAERLVRALTPWAASGVGEG